MPRIKAATVTQYIAAAPPEARKHLRALRAILAKIAPRATEAIKWGVPVFEERRILFAFAAYKTHLNFMPTASAMSTSGGSWRESRSAASMRASKRQQKQPPGISSTDTSQSRKVAVSTNDSP